MLPSRLLAVCSLALLPVLSACNSDKPAGSGDSSATSSSKQVRPPANEYTVVLSVPDMTDSRSVDRASDALAKIEGVVRVTASTRDNTLTVVTAGVVAPVKLIQALSKAGLFASVAR
ncbi:MAG: hypothetical protein ACI8QC_002170 [Planctomycetota bacterium]|jgi:hypothetical protein